MNLVKKININYPPGSSNLRLDACLARPVYLFNLLEEGPWERIRRFKRRRGDKDPNVDIAGYLEYDKATLETLLGYRDVIFAHETWDEDEQCFYLNVGRKRFGPEEFCFYKISLGRNKDMFYIDTAKANTWANICPFVPELRKHIERTACTIVYDSVIPAYIGREGYCYAADREGNLIELKGMQDYSSKYPIVLYFENPLPPEFREKSIFAKEGLYWKN